MTASSMISTTLVSMTSGAAPGYSTRTDTTGKSTSGNWLTPMREAEMPPNRMSPAISIQAHTGRRVALLCRVVFLRGLGGLAQRVQLRTIEVGILVGGADLLLRLTPRLTHGQLGLGALRHRLAPTRLGDAAGVPRHGQRPLHLPIHP